MNKYSLLVSIGLLAAPNIAKAQENSYVPSPATCEDASNRAIKGLSASMGHSGYLPAMTSALQAELFFRIWQSMGCERQTGAQRRLLEEYQAQIQPNTH